MKKRKIEVEKLVRYLRYILWYKLETRLIYVNLCMCTKAYEKLRETMLCLLFVLLRDDAFSQRIDWIESKHIKRERERARARERERWFLFIFCEWMNQWSRWSKCWTIAHTHIQWIRIKPIILIIVLIMIMYCVLSTVYQPQFAAS